LEVKATGSLFQVKEGEEEMEREVCWKVSLHSLCIEMDVSFT
jgi:hypothetical protein